MAGRTFNRDVALLHKESSESIIAIDLTTSRTCNRRFCSTLCKKIYVNEDKAQTVISAKSVVTRTVFSSFGTTDDTDDHG
jgi:hypothetical protein